MIVEFSVKNFRSIKELQTISFVATNLKSSDENLALDKNNICKEGEYRLLKTIGIYGANASGKSNIIKALEYFAQAISDLPSPESRLSKLAQPFLFQKNPEETESFFQIILILNGKKYRYGFTVKKNLDKLITEENKISAEIISSEWLFGPKEKNQVNYFLRSDLKIDKSNLPDEKNIGELQYKHTLFLTHAASYSKDICATIRDVIHKYTTTKFSSRNDFYRFHSIRQIENEKMKKNLIEFLSLFDLKYESISIKKDEEAEKANNFPLENVLVTKLNKGNNSKSVVLNMQHNESEGTKKLFDIAGLLLHAFNIRTGGLIILDEIDSNFHPSLVIKLINMFNDPSLNKSRVQLLFTSHDTNLLSPEIMRRDQFYFTEKDRNDATRLYSLADLKGIRNDADFAKQYLAGFYGALPVLEEYSEKKFDQNDGALEF